MSSWIEYKYTTQLSGYTTAVDLRVFNAVPEALLDEYARAFREMNVNRPSQMTPEAFRSFVIHHRRIDIAAGRVTGPKPKSRLAAVTFVGED